MGIIKNLISKAAGASTTDMLLVRDLAMPGLETEPIIADKCYIEIYVESLRLTHARRFVSKFDGVVYAFLDVSREGDADARYGALTRPNMLADLDSRSLENVLIVERKLVGPIAYRGGPIGLELGLFSIQHANLLTPLLQYITRLSEAAGASFIGTAKPFLPFIEQGMTLLSGQASDCELEVGIGTDIMPRHAQSFALVAADKQIYAKDEFSVDTGDRKLLWRGKPVTDAHCVLSIRATPYKSDFGEIPELKLAYSAVQAAIRRQRRADAKEALSGFRAALYASSDLISSDAEQLMAKVEARVMSAFAASAIAARQSDVTEEPLSNIGLYT